MRKLYIILAAGLISLSAAAQTSEALPFIQMDFSTVSLGMGSTAIPSAAVLPLKETKVAGGVAYESYMPALSATKYISGGAAGALGKLGYSIAFTRGTGEPVTGEKFAPSEIMVNAGASYVVIDALAVGVNVKYGKEQLLANYANSAVAFDVFAAASFAGFEIAAGASALGGKVKSESSGDFSLPAAVTLGAGYSAEFGEVHAVTARVKADRYFSGPLAAGLGVEYGYSDLVFARAGYHYGGDSIIPSFASAGLGLHYGNLNLDAAYLFASDILGGTFSVSAGVRF
ncbi:MAG: hypothetical protein IKN93_00765 [Bacteroidales bacterium]|nr:hypothetical protein [Bacteroidales bacterium]